MAAVSIAETRAKLSAIMDKVETGETQVITRRGKPIAKIVPADSEVLAPRPRLDVEAMRRHVEKLIGGGAPVVDAEVFRQNWKDEQRY